MRIDGHLIDNLKSILPKFEGNQTSATTSLINAWAESICLDPISGGLYVKTAKLHTILRYHAKADAQYIVDSIPDKKKILIGDEVYVATSALIY